MYTGYCIACTLQCTLATALRARCNVHWLLHCVHVAMYTGYCTQRATLECTLATAHSVLRWNVHWSTAHSVLRWIVHWSTAHSVLVGMYTVYCTQRASWNVHWSTAHSVLVGMYTVYCTQRASWNVHRSTAYSVLRCYVHGLLHIACYVGMYTAYCT